MRKYVHLPTIILSAFIVKALIRDVSIGDAVLAVALSALYGWHMHLESSKEEPINLQVKAEISEFRSEIGKMKDTINGLKIASSVRR